MDGWIKLHRKLLKNPIFSNEKGLKVFIWCLLKASHGEVELYMGTTLIKLLPGQFIYGREQSARELLFSPSTVRNWIGALKRDGYLDIKSNNKYSIVTIRNWEQYQEDGHQDGHHTDNKRTTKGQQKDTNKNDKNVKNVKNIQTPLPPSGDAGSGSDPVVVKEQTVLQRPAGNTEHEIGHYIIELFRDINPDTRRLHALKTEMNAALTLYKTGVYGDLTKMENAIRLLPQLATGKYCPKEIKLISKPSQMLTYWALYCSYAKGIKEDINNSGPLIL